MPFRVQLLSASRGNWGQDVSRCPAASLYQGLPSRKKWESKTYKHKALIAGSRNFFGGSEVEELLTIEELAALLRVPPSWIYSRTGRRSANRIPGFRLGKYWRFRREGVVAWLNRQSAGCPNA